MKPNLECSLTGRACVEVSDPPICPFVRYVHIRFITKHKSECRPRLKGVGVEMGLKFL